MPDAREPQVQTNLSTAYQIRVRGHLRSQWTDWFEGLAIVLDEDGDTLLTGAAIDQAALYGLLKKVRDLGLPLISVIPVIPEETSSNSSGKGNG
jgi:hypothetical protein